VNETKAIIIAIAGLVFFNFFFVNYVGLFSTSVDYVQMYSCTTEGVFIENIESCSTYPPLFMFIAKMFSVREIFFKQLILFLFAFVMPLVLYKITKEPITVWFYFSTINFFYAIITSGFFSQGLSMILIFSMFFLKGWKRMAILPLTIIAHSTSFLIAIVVYLLIALEEYYNKTYPNKKIFGELKKFFVCSPFWGIVPKEFNSVINQTVLDDGFTSINIVLSVLFKRIPIFFFIPAIYKFYKEKMFALFLLSIFFIVVGFFIHARSFYFAGLPMVIGLTYFYKDCCKTKKKIILLGSIVYFVFFVQQLYALGMSC